ncbi:MAG TPA: hypothetical protein VGG57_18905 [Stellaceae bacterium]|jgi:hypothetical protein
MPDPTSAFATGNRRLLWAGLLLAASLLFTLGFACAVPFAAFGAIAAMTLPRRDALLVVIALWLVNQIAGFTILHYPWDAMTLAWGPIFGAVAVASTLAARAATRNGGLVQAALAGFAAAFVVYEGALYIVSATVMGGTEIYTPAIIGRILAINAAGFVALLAASLLITAAGAHVRMSGEYSA